jgi:AcrR family transcriptional regulator
MNETPATRQPKAMQHSPAEIAQARQMYLDGVTVSQICKACEMSIGALYYWLDGGPTTGEHHLVPLPRRNVGRPPARRRLSGDRVALVSRLWRTAEAQVREIEERLALNRQQPDERERDARTLAVLVKTLRELSALDDAKDAAKRGTAPQANTDDDDAGPRDIDEFRRELARRMDAIVAARTADPAGEPQER